MAKIVYFCNKKVILHYVLVWHCCCCLATPQCGKRRKVTPYILPRWEPIVQQTCLKKLILKSLVS